MKAILIDPITETIEELNVENDHRAGHRLVEYMRDEHGDLPPATDLAPVDKHNQLIVDETGMMESRDPKHFFHFNGVLYVGRAVLTGYYRNEAAGGDTTFTIEQVKANVKFADARAHAQWGGLEEARKMEVVTDPAEIRRLLRGE